MRSKAWGILLLPLCGCVVLASTHEEVTGQLEAEVRQRDTRIHDLQTRVQALEKTEETLQLERQSLVDERIALMNDIEDMREGNEELRLQIETERKVRENREQEIEEISESYQSLVEKMEDELESGRLEIHRLRGRLQVRALEQILFDSGSAAIKPEGVEVLTKLAGQLSTIGGHRIRVEGHTDPVPIATARYPSNWELSVARAASVVRLLEGQGISADKLEASGFGPYQPIADNESVQGRARNRRIEIVLVPEADD